jgi:DNA-binding NtrC family response regulator
MDSRVLLVDDEVAFGETLAKRLRRRGLTVDVASSGQGALDRIKASGPLPQVVVLDLRMPGLDGLAVLGRIKARHPAAQVIILTGHGTVDSAVMGLKQGAFDYLLKPCDVDLLLDKINEAQRAADKFNETDGLERVGRGGDSRG